MTKDAPHILMVLESWGEGGTESFVHQLIEWLGDNTDIRISACLLKAKATDREVAAQVLNIADRDIYVLGDGNAGPIFLQFLHLLRRLRPDVAHLHLYSSLLPAVVASRGAGVPRVVTTLHIPLWQWSLRHRIAWRLGVCGSDWVTGTSSASLRSISRVLNPRRARCIWPPVVSQARLEPVRTKPGFTAPPFVIAGVGRLDQQKNWDVLLQALYLLDRESPGSWQVRLFGDGPEYHSLREMTMDLGLDAAVRFEGFVSLERLVEMLSISDACVLPSRFEGLGMAAIEAMALGLPTITADFEASADYIEHGITGHVFPRGDANTLAALLKWHSVHPQQARAIAECGQNFVRERFHPDTVFAPMMEIYGGC